MNLRDDIENLKGIGPKKAKVLRDAGINSLQDIISILPYRYEDRRNAIPIGKTVAEQYALIEGKIVSKQYFGSIRSRMRRLLIFVEDETGIIEVVFFNGTYVNNMIKEGEFYSFFGQIKDLAGRKQIVHPEFHKLGTQEDLRGIIPVYKAIKTISGTEIRKWIYSMKDIISDMNDWLSEEFLQSHKLCDIGYALNAVHFPQNGRQVLEGKYRLIFDELFVLEAGLFYMRRANSKEKSGVEIDCSCVNEFINKLAFKLTKDQIRAIDSISKDLASSHAMNRLIQGDVGSGKTVIAQSAMYAAAKSGFQSAMMAPTEILAKQHFDGVSTDFEPLGIKVALLTSGMKQSEKKKVKKAIELGEIDVIIGTHAVISDDVKYHNLGLVITDEQHRFGVRQRATLSDKGKLANVMVMTATPIPRTLAVIVYGDLDISVIKTMPKGRKTIITRSCDNELERQEIYENVEAQIRNGRQAYVVAPLISESDVIDAKSAEAVYEELKQRFKKIKIALLHGEMKQDEKDAIMLEFSKGNIDILVSTVVIEVGVNVPNATIMIIENCERFGLAQMHQLRGRVGRGNHQSYCYLMLGRETASSIERAKVLTRISDGFEIAEEDLRLRGPGDVFGVRQHGLPDLRIADLARHGEVLEKARMCAKKIIEEDADLTLDKNHELKNKLKNMYGENISLQM